MKKIPFILILLFLYKINFAQNSSVHSYFNLEWDNLWSSTDSIANTANDLDLSGNIYVAGHVVTLNNGTDMAMLKYDSTGILIFNRKINGSNNSNDVTKSVTCDNLGNSYWTGTISETGLFQNQMCVYKLSPTGNILWTFIYNAKSEGVQIKKASNGSILVLGAVDSGISNDYVIVSIDESTGISNWSYSYSSSNNDKPVKFSFNSNNEIYVLGQTQIGASLKMVVTSLNASGSLLWEGIVNNDGSHSQIPKEILINSNDELILGSENSVDSIQPQPYAMGVLKMSNSGQILWDTIYSANNLLGDVLHTIKLDQNDNIILSGSSALNNKSKLNLLKINTNNELLWSQVYYGSGNLRSNSIAINDQNIVLTAVGRTGQFLQTVLVGFDQNGNETWVKNLNTRFVNSIGADILFDNYGNIYHTGHVTTSSPFFQILTEKYTYKELQIPPDFFGEKANAANSIFQNKGQIIDIDRNVISSVRYTTSNDLPKKYFLDTTIVFVEYAFDTIVSTSDTVHRVDMNFVSDYSSELNLMPIAPVHNKINYYTDYAPNGIEHITGYERLIYQDIWQGIDCHFYSAPTGTRISFYIGEGANPSQIKFKLSGQSNLNISSNGELEVITELNGWKYNKVNAYQLDANNQLIALNWQPDYTILNGNEIVFTNIGTFDNEKPLVFQMDNGVGTTKASIGNLEWSSYICSMSELSSSGTNEMRAVSAKSNGLIYAGHATTSYFPTANGWIVYTPFPNNFSEGIIFAMNHNMEPQWATFFGGSGNDYIESMDVQVNTFTAAQRKVVVGGWTFASDIPLLTPGNAYYDQRLIQGANPDKEAFIASFMATNGTLYWSTYYGEYQTNEVIIDLEVDRFDNIWVGGTFDFIGSLIVPPSFINKIQGLSASFTPPFTTFGSGFLLKFNKFGEEQLFTDIAGWSSLKGIDSDPIGNIYITGMHSTLSGLDFGTLQTLNSDPLFPQTSSFDNSEDMFIAGINGSSNQLEFLMAYKSDAGGSETGHSIKYGTNNTFYVIGETNAIDVPTKDVGGDYHKTTLSGGTDAVIMEIKYDFNASLPLSLEWATYFGGDYAETFFSTPYQSETFDIIVDNNGNIICVANADNYNNAPLTSTNYLPVPYAQPLGSYFVEEYPSYDFNQEGIIFAFDSGKNLIWSSFFGGEGWDWIHACDYNTSLNRLYISGYTETANYHFPNSPFPFPITEYDLSNSLDHYDENGYPTYPGFGAMFTLNDINTPIPNVSVEEIDIEGITVYPNPFQESFMINADKNINAVKIYDNLGRLIQTLEGINTTALEVPTVQLAKGIYYINIELDEKVITKKIIKQ